MMDGMHGIWGMGLFGSRVLILIVVAITALVTHLMPGPR